MITRLRLRKAMGDLRAHRGRTVLTWLAVTAALAAAATVLDAWALVREVTRDQYLASAPAAATIVVDPLTPDARARALAAVRAVPGVRDAEAHRAVSTRIQVGGTVLGARLFVSDDPAAQRVGRLRIARGAWPAAAGPDIAIERSSLDFAGLTLGDRVQLGTADGDGWRAAAVGGVAHDVGLAPGWMEHVVYAWVSRATLAALGFAPGDDALRLLVVPEARDRAAVRRIAAEARRALEQAGIPVRDVEVPEPGAHPHAAQMDSLLFTQGAFGVLGLVLAAFLVVQLMTAMLAGQAREMGVLKAIGARDGQLAALALASAGAIGLAATLVAMPVAAAAGARYGALKAEMLNFDLAGARLPWWVLLLQGAVGVALPLLAALPPVRRATRRPVAEALRDVGLRADAAVPALLLHARWLPRPTRLALRNAFRRRQRLVLTVLALAIAGGTYVGARGLRRAVLATTSALFDSQRFDLTVRLAEPAPVPAVEAALGDRDGIAAAEAWAGTAGAVVHEDGTLGDGIPIAGVEPATSLLVPDVVAGRWLAPGDSLALVVGRGVLHDEPALVPGARVTLRSGGHDATWTVVGIAEMGLGLSAYAPRAAVLPIAGGATTLAVRARGRSDGAQLALVGRLRTQLGEAGLRVAGSSRTSEARRATEDHLLLVVQFLGAMGWLLLAVGALGLASTMAIAVLERTREIGVLRALGARDRSLLLMVQAEGLVIGLLGWACALPLSVPIAVGLGEAFSRIMLPVPLRLLPDAGAVLAWLAVVVVVSALASAVPAWRAARVPAARALSYE